MSRGIQDRNVLERFALGFCEIVERHCPYIIVSGFVAIASGRTRATEDIDMILPRIDKARFTDLHQDLVKAGFEVMQGGSSASIYDHYLKDGLSIRYIRVGSPLPEMEVKLAKDPLDEYQLKTRMKIPLTGLDLWFSSIDMNIAFKEELLKSAKDLEDAAHLRRVFTGQVDEKEIKSIKALIKRYRL
ncbi:MAG: hypothetical protein AABX47_00485 [Nanoarchaeota archaeon]